MTIACALLQQHIQTLVEDNAQWQRLIADDIVWELTYAPSLGHPARLSGREEVVRHATWFVGTVERFRFFDLVVHAFADPEGAVAEVKGEGLIKTTGRVYRQNKDDGACLSPRLCGLPACCMWQDRVPAGIFRSRACGHCGGCTDSWSQALIFKKMGAVGVMACSQASALRQEII
jgi:ketosteroid isomerase-like protein